MAAHNKGAEGHYIGLLLQRLGIVYLLFSLCRLMFYCCNAASFEGIAIGETAYLFFVALRFDTSSILYVNLLVILMHLLPIAARNSTWYQKTMKGLFFICNGLVLLLEVADIAYFPYAFRRILRNDFEMSDDIQNLLPQFMLEFWWLLLFYFFLLMLAYYLYYKTEKKVAQKTRFVPQFFVLLIAAALTFIGLRGGLQDRPLMPIVASLYVSNAQYMPLVNNTTLGLIHSFQQRTITYKPYFDENELERIYSLKRKVVKDSFQKKNVVILICESLGREYVGYFGEGESHTPFLDSMLNEGANFINMYANGNRSTQGLVAIAGGFPSLMLDPFMFSAYQNNNLTGLGDLLGEEGYSTAFFHGGEVGTMSFDKFLPIVGVNNYYGRTQYIEDNNYEKEQDYDGNWGIWDVPFYDYALNKINRLKKPFLGILFSINVHHPFNVEPWFAQQYPNTDKRLVAIKYADYNLRQFFEKASKMPWFSNTLFVITADHTGVHRSPKYIHREGSYRIPLLMYNPSDSTLVGLRKEVTQQIDIMPSVLGYLGYPKLYEAFGSNKFDSSSTAHYSYTFQDDIYQIIGGDFVLQFDGTQSVALYNRVEDIYLKKNIIEKHPKVVAKLEEQLKAVIQRHDRKLISNQ